MPSKTLSIIDYIILVLLLLSSAIIGTIFGFFKSKKNSSKEFLLGINCQRFSFPKLNNKWNFLF